MPEVFLGGDDNRFVGSAADDLVFGEGGDDALTGNLGNDSLYGGSGRDFLASGRDGGVDGYFGGAGDDYVDAGLAEAGDVVRGGVGHDRLVLDYRDLEQTGEGIRLDWARRFEVFHDGAALVHVESVEALAVHGSDGDDHIALGAGDDAIYGGRGFDVMSGGAGDDSFLSGGGDFDIDGGTGIDWMKLSLKLVQIDVAWVVGAEMRLDTPLVSGIARSVERVWLKTGDGNDDLRGGRYSDRFEAGAGNDTVRGGNGHDVIDGGNGTNVLFGGAGGDSFGTQGYVDAMANRIYGGGGGDGIEDRSQGALVHGGAGNDRITAYGSGSTIYGGQGDDTINGGFGATEIRAGAGDDVVGVYYPDEGPGIVDGGRGTNHITFGGSPSFGPRGAVAAEWDSGVLRVTLDGVLILTAAGFQAAALHGGSFADTLSGGGGDDLIAGNTGNFIGVTGDDDLLSGGAGNDTVEGWDGADSLFGGDGDDILEGGMGADEMTGGAGSDIFLFRFPSHSTPGAGRDVILDFGAGDRIDLRPIDPDSPDGAFRLIGAAAFSGSAGELRYRVEGDSVILLGDLDGDGTADVAVEMRSVATLDAGSLLL